jgi:hypothetical protein
VTPSNAALGALTCGQHYYCKIVAKCGCGETSRGGMGLYGDCSYPDDDNGGNPDGYAHQHAHGDAPRMDHGVAVLGAG